MFLLANVYAAEWSTGRHNGRSLHGLTSTAEALHLAKSQIDSKPLNALPAEATETEDPRRSTANPAVQFCLEPYQRSIKRSGLYSSPARMNAVATGS